MASGHVTREGGRIFGSPDFHRKIHISAV